MIMKPFTNEILPQGYKMTELGALPKEWKVVRLEECLELLRNGITKEQNKLYKGFPVSRIETISTGKINIKKIGYIDNLSDDEIEKYRLKEGDILFSHINSEPYLGNSVIYENEPKTFIHGMNLLLFRVKAEILDAKFLNFLFNYYRNKGVFLQIASRSVNQSSINQGKIKTLPIPLPPLPEQQKIAAVLSAVQEAKEKTEAVIAATKALKKSMMKHLFTYGPVSPQEAENVPLKETEIGSVPEEWEVVRLGEIGNIITGNTPSKNIKEYWEKGEIEFIKPPDLQNQKIVTFSEKISNSAVIKARIVHQGTILVSCIGIIGRVGLSQKSIAFNQQINAIVPNENIYNHFLFYAIQVQQKQIENLASFTTVPIVSKAKFSTVKIPLPPLPTQQKIASILSAIDEKIEAEENKKKALEELFKSLLHDLMTAKIRVNQLEISS